MPIRAITENDLLALTEGIDNNKMPIDARDSVCAQRLCKYNLHRFVICVPMCVISAWFDIAHARVSIWLARDRKRVA